MTISNQFLLIKEFRSSQIFFSFVAYIKKNISCLSLEPVFFKTPLINYT